MVDIESAAGGLHDLLHRWRAECCCKYRSTTRTRALAIILHHVITSTILSVANYQHRCCSGKDILVGNH
jgi:hypothetical protein